MTAARLTPAQKVELWKQWRDGTTLSAIAKALHRSPPAIFSSLRERGGFSPCERRRNSRHLQAQEREAISRGLAAGHSLRSIARDLGKNVSTVSREISRNYGAGRYRAEAAEKRAWLRAQRPKKCLLASQPKLREFVAEKLALQWSPQQIAGHLRSAGSIFYVSHETIYRSLFIQARNVLKRELCDHLRRNRRFRHGRNHTNKGQTRGTIQNAISIRERPAEIEDRAIPGHWEGDLIAGSRNSYIATLVERNSRFVLLARVTGKDTQTVTKALVKCMNRLPRHITKTLTWDRGLEMADHAQFTLDTNMRVYFCDPKSPWQRGSNENTNGLLRQYFPKKTPLGHYTQLQLDRVSARLNTRPRKTLRWKTPVEMLNQMLH